MAADLDLDLDLDHPPPYADIGDNFAVVQDILNEAGADVAVQVFLIILNVYCTQCAYVSHFLIVIYDSSTTFSL